MSFLDWCILIIPICFVFYMGWHSRRYICQVSDFLSAGRLCGRYVISVADIANALSIIGLVAYVEVHYRTGFALAFWQNIFLPATIVFSLTGFCTYRFRETKAMSFGQFLEMRYSRKFRIFAATLRSISEMLANMIMPAIAARFFIYYLGLPHHVSIFGVNISTFSIVVLVVLTMAIAIICMGGTLALVITDSIQGMMCYPLMAVFVIFVLMNFSWTNEIVPVMCDRVSGESFLNPYDIENFRDFNFFFVFVQLITMILNRANWIGAGNSSAARSPHEQKMAAMLGTWKGALNNLFYVLIAVVLVVAFNHKNFGKTAHDFRSLISYRVADEFMPAEMRDRIANTLKSMPIPKHEIGVDAPLSDVKNLDTPYLDKAKGIILAGYKDEAAGHKQFQQFRTLYKQMMTAVGMRNLLPNGMVGLFCLLLVMAMISTDDTRIFSASLTLTQDVIVPLCKKPLTPEQHINVLRWVSIGVGVFFFFGSFLMSQLDYVQLFSATMTSMWVGAGSMMVFGLYSRFGTTAGAWASLLTGMGIALSYIGAKEYWTNIYQFLDKNGWAESVGNFLASCSAPFEPFIVWRINPTKCPINAYEVMFITMACSMLVYIIVSKLTCKEPFNLDRLLHRGKYNLDGDDKQRKTQWSWKTVASKLIGITPEYTSGDKCIAWALFIYSVIWQFLILFVGVIIWNTITPWPITWWQEYFLWVFIVIPGIIAVISAFWFGIGGIIDLRRLFRDLNNRVINYLDNGAVEGNMSLADKAKLEAVDAEAKEEK